MVYFAFCIHNHQPAGNFDFVMEEAYENSYWPFLDTLAKHPSIKLTLHNSGYLLDWMEANRPEYIELLKKLVARGQVEVLGGGYYEPVLPVIPDHDRAGQLQLMSDRLLELAGKRPRGIWLTERVWEPTLPGALAEAGVEYLLVDDNHFIKAGLERDVLGGYYITEDRGRMVKVLAGSEPLRYLIPFKPVEELEKHLAGLPGFFKRGNAAIYGDDGEKFGVWPGTYKWVFTDGWLESFFRKIEELDFVKPVTLSEYIDASAPIGRVYLPTTSYMEMGEWTLPKEAAEAYYALTEEFKHKPGGEKLLRFVQGGTWRNFFAKYPESNWMHKRMLLVSAALAGAERARPGAVELAEARRHLYKAQCNDAYWHGVFGGLYLPHLREEVYGNLLAAESLIEGRRKGVDVRSLDVDIDGEDEIIVDAGEMKLFLSPAAGGSLVELDFKPARVNLANTLARWPEAYHSKLEKDDKEDQGDKGTRSIHDIVVSKEEGLHRFLTEDKRRRGSLIDHFIAPNETIDAFKANTFGELGDFADGVYTAACADGSVRLTRPGVVDGAKAEVIKEITPAGPASFDVTYNVGGLKNGAGVCLGVELNFLFPCCEGPACYYGFEDEVSAHVPPDEIGLGSTGEISGLKRLTLTDGFTGVMLTIEADRPVTLWRYPVHTVSLSEAGFEKIFQGSCLLFKVPLEATGKGGAKGHALKLTVRAERFLK